MPWYSSVADPQRKPITTTIARLDSHPEERSRVANVSMVKSPKTANRKRWTRTGNHQVGATGEGGSEEAKNKRVTAIQPRVAHEANGLATLLGLVAAGFGATILAQSLVRLHVDNLVYRQFSPPLETRLWLVHHIQLSPTARNFVELVQHSNGVDPITA